MAHLDQRLLKKIHRNGPNSYYGRFTPTEILILFDTGWIYPMDISKKGKKDFKARIEWIREHKKLGDSATWQMDFSITKELKLILEEYGLLRR